MITNLFINYYVDSSKERQKEINACVVANINNDALDTVTILLGDNDLIALNDLTNRLEVRNQLKINTIVFEGRPSYNDYFKLSKEYPCDINIISNTDIIMDYYSVQKLKSWNWDSKCLALSRWDFINNNLNINEATHYNRADSQDTWIVRGVFPDIEAADFTLGVAGCDNSIAYLLSKHYDVINPSLDIKTYHYHITNIRNYLNVNNLPIETILPPYKLITPTTLS